MENNLVAKEIVSGTDSKMRKTSCAVNEKLTIGVQEVTLNIAE